MRLLLHKPAVSEFSYTQYLMEDPCTMDYNRGFDLSNKNYNKKTGCIAFPRELWESMYERYKILEEEQQGFYRYVYDAKRECFVGDVAVQYKPTDQRYMVHLLIEGAHRGKGYGKEGLRLLLEKSFDEFHLPALFDTFPKTRKATVNLFLGMGFQVVEEHENGIIGVELLRESYNTGGSSL